MTCAACSGRVQRTLERTEGVASANVNLMTGAATVAYDPSVTSPERLVDAIRGTGYGAELPQAGRVGRVAARRPGRRARGGGARAPREAALSASVGVIAMALGMLHLGSGADRRDTPLLGAHPARGRLGRPAFLHPGLGRLPAPQRRHEHADRRRHRRRVPVQRGRDPVRPTGSPPAASSRTCTTRRWSGSSR